MAKEHCFSILCLCLAVFYTVCAQPSPPQPETRHYLKGSELTLGCEFNLDLYNATFDLTWILNGTSIVTSANFESETSTTVITSPRYVFDNTTGSLVITKLIVNDTGRYVCNVEADQETISIEPFITEHNIVVHAAPQAPVNLSVDALNSTAIKIAWRPPAKSYFAFTGHDVIVRSTTSIRMEQHVSADTTQVVFGNLTADTKYFVSVLACVVDRCSRPSEQKSVRTHEDRPSKPLLYPVNARESDSVNIVWLRPSQQNGALRGYLIHWQEQTEDGEPAAAWNTFNYTDATATSFNIEGLKPWTKYIVYIQAYNNAGISDNSDSYPTFTERTAPSSPMNVTVRDSNSTSVVVTWVQPELITGMVDSYRIRYRVVQRSNADAGPIYLTIDNDYPKKYHRKVIHHLSPGTRYSIEVQAITNSFFLPKTPFLGPFSRPVYVDTAAVNIPAPPQENNSIFVAVIVLIVITIILIALIIGYVVMRKYMSKRMGRYSEVNQCGNDPIGLNDIYGESVPVRADILVEKFAEHVANNHANNDLLFSEEFDDINQSSRTDLPVKHSLDPENVRIKNRYVNILAYDHSRVILRPLSGQHGDSTYINANYIDGYSKPRSYIATQGPLTQTASDFWRMTWEQNSAVIVMITNLTERGRRKCDQYWPSEGDHVYGLMNVRLLSESVTAHYTLRKFMLKCVKDARISVRKRGNAERVIHQFHFTEWPDHGVPDYPLPVLQYLNRSIAAIPEGSGPPIVHCSAGVGRTGTYIVIDSMIKQVEDKQSINVYSFLTHIRQQRNYMVQTEEQYVFIHDVMLEYIQSGTTEVQASNLTQYILDLKNVHERKASKLEKQYELAVSYTPRDYEVLAAEMDVNKTKNRSKKILPVEISRVKLPMVPGVLGSDYINASYMQGYFKRDEYIVTQHPLRDTVEDFWRMVWDQNTMTIVLLSEVDSQDYVEFWPAKDETVPYANFTMTFINEIEQGQNVYRDFLLQSTQDDYECTTRLISPTECWPEQCKPLSSAFDLVNTVKQWHGHHEVEGPIIVVDRFGGKEAATFCLLSTLQDQIDQDNSLDVYLNAKLYHLKRPGVFPSEESYLYIYRAMEALCAEEGGGPSQDKDSGISQCNNYRGSLPPGVLPDLPPPAVIRSSSRNSAIRNESPVNRMSTL